MILTKENNFKYIFFLVSQLSLNKSFDPTIYKEQEKIYNELVKKIQIKSKLENEVKSKEKQGSKFKYITLQNLILSMLIIN